MEQAASSDSQRIRMLETPVEPLIVKLAIPTIISMMVTSIYNMADTYFVSQLSTSASGAVGIVFSLMAIIQAVGFTIGMGSGSMASRLLGKSCREEADAVASSALLMAVVLGGGLTGLALWRLEDLVWALGATPTIFPYAVDYAFYILLAAPVMVVAFVLNNLLRWQGRANRSVIGLGIGGLLNMVLDPVLIFGLDMGIAGAAIATALSQCVSMVILASFFLTGHTDIHPSPRKLSRRPGVYLSILKGGLPSFLRQGLSSVSTMTLNYSARIYGDAAVAAMAIVTKVFNFIMSMVIGFGQGLQPVVGFNYGAGRTGRVKTAVIFALKLSTALLAAAAVVGFVGAPWIVGFFRDDPLVVDIGTRAFRYQCLSLPLGAVITYSNMLFQSMGKSWRASLMAVCRQGIFFIPLVWYLPQRLGLTGVECSQTISDVISFLLCGGVMLHFFLREFPAGEGQPARK